MTARVHISIDSLEALERLIGGNTDAEISIREGIVEAFEKKHLTSVAAVIAERGFDKLTADMHKHVESVLAEKFSVSPWNRSLFTLESLTRGPTQKSVTEAIQAGIRKSIADEINKMDVFIRSQVAERIEGAKQYADDKLEQVDRRIDTLALDVVKRVEDKRFDAEVNRRVTKILAEAAALAKPPSMGRAIDVTGDPE